MCFLVAYWDCQSCLFHFCRPVALLPLICHMDVEEPLMKDRIIVKKTDLAVKRRVHVELGIEQVVEHDLGRSEELGFRVARVVN